MASGNTLLLVIALSLGAVTARAESKKAEADKHYQLGKSHYNLNHWDEAIEAFKTAYEKFPDAVNLFNIAQAYRLKGGNCANAATYYTKYQAEEKNKKRRDSVDKVRKQMEDCAKTEKTDLPVPPMPPAVDGASPATGPAPITPGTATPPTGEDALRTLEPANLDPNRNRRILSYVLLGLGGLSVVAGVGYSVQAGNLQNKIDDCNGVGDGCGFFEVQALEEDRDYKTKQAAGAYSFGALCVIGGAILYAVSRKPKSDQPSKVTVMPTRNGAALGWSF